MSRSHRKALKLLIMILHFEELGFIKGLTGQVNKIIDLYMEEDKFYTKSQMEDIIKFYELVESYLKPLNYLTSEVMMFSIILAISDHFIAVVKHEGKLKEFKQLSYMLTESISKNYINFTDELDKAAEIAEYLISKS